MELNVSLFCFAIRCVFVCFLVKGSADLIFLAILFTSATVDIQANYAVRCRLGLAGKTVLSDNFLTVTAL